MRKMMINTLDAFTNENMISPEFKREQELLQGLSGAGTAQLIGRCVSFMDSDKVYLEVGIYQAANLVLVASRNKNKQCYGVDNFSQEFQENQNFKGMTTEEVVVERIKNFGVEKNCKFFKSDFREFLCDRSNIDGKKVEVYFFDGPHELQDQIDGVEYAFPLLADEAIIFVDDWLSENVQEATKVLLDKHKELELIKILRGGYSSRELFNQGQCVFKFTRKK
jgi:hypothetical protein